MTDIERAEEFANNGYALGCTKSPFEALQVLKQPEKKCGTT